MSYKFLKQREENDCGIAVSTMLINYYQNKNFGIEEIKFDNSLGDEMLSLYDIESLLFKYKVEFVSYSCNFKELCQIEITNPIVLNVVNKNNQEHFIVAYKRNKDMFLIADPNCDDLKWISLNNLEKIYQGYLSTTKSIQKLEFKTKGIFNWFTFIKIFKKEVLLIFSISFLLNILFLISNNFIKIYMDNINIKDSRLMKIIFITFISIFAIQISINYSMNKIIYRIKSKISQNIYNLYKNKLLKLDIEKFNSFSKEEWIKKLTYINIMSEFITQTTISIPLGTILFLMSSIFLLLISPFILSLVLVQNLISITISVGLFYLMKELKMRKERKILEFSLNYRQIIDGFEEIKYKGIEEETKYSNHKTYKENIEVNNNLFNLNNKSEMTFDLVSKLFFYLIFYISVIYINDNKFSVADLLFYTSLSNYINNFFSNITNFILELQEIFIADRSLKFIFEDRKNDSVVSISSIDKIEAKNIYKYKSDNCLLKDFSFTFNKSTFVHGKSGSGKTTLLKLLSGNFKSYEGEIIINEKHNLKEVENKSYLEKSIYLGQYDYLFNGSVWKNIQQFKNKVDLDILKKLHLLEILDRNNISLDKEIFDNASNLSKGQRQIVNFISLFFTNKELYLIDEPLSNVDKHTAYFLFKAFINYKKNSLIIMCDHDIAYANFFEKKVEVL
ncbi:ATP-binding cassette domain-containing protein [Spiroplasma monobiae]|uniref:Bacteriocin ABC transporter n=1 Tax=Spiroplasma monobiae MQ-1 TaxID=1336748 RepID=A0A2K9LUT5_SPISQ|nr:ATP-binding cassette domain-containing protein [Spiroplasma monobiae]AUM62808.1 bacteriocin ABC transporter [Spiroplasma monobiae MQ-1]